MVFGIEKLSANPPRVALSRAIDHIPSFPRKRESSGRGLNTRDGTQSFQTASERLLNPLCLALTLCLLLLSRALADTPLTIVEQGQSQTRVGVHPEAGEWERRAASDLVRYIEEMSGARLPLIDRADALEQALTETTPLILVGQTALEAEPSLEPRLQALQKPRPVLRSDAIIAQRQGNRIYLAGTNDESHYYAAVELLHHWGCRWYLPTDFGASIPQQSTLTIDTFDVAYAPPFEVRRYWLSWHGDNSGRAEFMRRNRLNDLSVPAGHALGHYVDDLPSAGSSAQAICLSDPATARHIAAQVMDRFAAGAQAVSLGMDDGLYDLACASDSVLAAGLWDKNFMSPALTDPFMALYNNVAELTQVRFPDRRIGFLAYSNITLPPQRRTVAAEPLVAYLAPIDVCPIHGMDDPTCPPSQEYRDVMYRWAQTMQGRLIIYDYDQSMLVWRDIPNPSIQAIRQDIQHYRAAGILGVDTESRGAMATTFLNLYLRSRLYWDPDVDIEAVLEEFYPRFFGPAAAPMRTYWQAIHRAWEQTPSHEHEFMLAPTVYTPKLVQMLAPRVAEAEILVADLPSDNLFVQRVRFVRAGFGVLQNYMDMVAQAVTQVDYPAAVQAGERGLAWRDSLTQMHPTFTTTSLERGDPWWTGEVNQYRDLSRLTHGPQGRLVQKLPLEWTFRTDPHDAGLHQGWGRPDLDLSSWRPLRTDLYMEVQGVAAADGGEYNGFAWYRTDIEISKAEAGQALHIRFPGLFGKAWLYVDGYLVGHRDWRPMWWHNDYRFEWDVDLSGVLSPGTHTLALRLHNEHHMGGIWRRPFLYEKRM